MMEPRTKAGRELVEGMTPVSPGAGCAHQGDSWFDRTFCAEPCGSMHQRCDACGSALGGCYFEGPEFIEQQRATWTATVIAIEDEAISTTAEQAEAAIRRLA